MAGGRWQVVGGRWQVAGGRWQGVNEILGGILILRVTASPRLRVTASPRHRVTFQIRREESLYSKLFNLFSRFGLFCRAVLDNLIPLQQTLLVFDYMHYSFCLGVS
ncbi:MAG: hypothetical protein F6K31_43555 [Symploca sp. SIO2G7]|nr:hypothetical protein [Symploca sp. SIO2G7]